MVSCLQHGAGPVELAVRLTAGSITIAVSDAGLGFGDGQTMIFDYSEHSPEVSREGHGLGLPLARRLIEAMHGRLVLAHRGPHPVIEIVLSRA